MSKETNAQIMMNIIFKVHQLVHITDKISDHKLQQECGVSLSQYLILRMIDKMPSANQQLAAQALNMSAAAVSKLIEKLEKDDLIQKKSQQSDRRQNQWELSSSGKKTLKQADKLLEFLSAGISKELNNQELLNFREYLEKTLHLVKDTSTFEF